MGEWHLGGVTLMGEWHLGGEWHLWKSTHSEHFKQEGGT